MAKKINNEYVNKLTKYLISKIKPESLNSPEFKVITDGSEGITIPQLGNIALTAAADNPLATLGGAATTGMNLSGLFDNDKFLGQGIGLGAGALASSFLTDDPYTKYMIATGAGSLGALFDKLRKKKEEENSVKMNNNNVYTGTR